MGGNRVTKGAALVGKIVLAGGVQIATMTGVPVDGASGTGAGVMRPGSLIINLTTGQHYQNVGTTLVPVWTAAGGATGSDVEIWNGTGGALAAGDLIYLSGFDATSQLPSVTKADADAGPLTAAIYVVREAIADASAGLAGKTYRLTAQNTNAGNVGDPVYLSATAGGYTLTIPSGTAHLQIVGRIEVKSATVGVVAFNVQGAIAGFLKQTAIAGGAAGNLTVTGVAVGDRLVSVIRLDRDATAANIALTDITSEFTISATNTINNAAGTNTTGDSLLVTYVDRT